MSLKLFVSEILFGYVMQGFFFILGLYAFNKVKIVKSKFFISSAIFIPLIYLIRHLPINFGVHSIILLLVLTLLGVFFLRLAIYPTILSALIMVVLGYLLEGINMSVMSYIMGKQPLIDALQTAFNKSIVAIPSNIMFVSLVLNMYFLAQKSILKKSK